MGPLNEKTSMYKIIGMLIVILNIICAVINFIVVWRSNSFFWALVTLLIYAVSTFISAVPFFALHEVIDRVERLEKAAIMSCNEFYEHSPEGQSSTWILKKQEEEPEEDYKGFSFDGCVQEPVVVQKKAEPICEKKVLKDRTWQCSCGKINPEYTGSCGCGEKRPEYKVVKKKLKINKVPVKMFEDRSWQCSCGKINQHYVGTCSCGERRPR